MRFLLCIFAVTLLLGFSQVTVSGQPLIKAAESDSSTKQIRLDTASKKAKYIPVDVRGRPLDTDGDGVPDYKDAELLTPSKCFPVDSLGQGVCPEPICCQCGYGCRLIDNSNCFIESILIPFSKGSYALSIKSRQLLDSLGNLLKANPNCSMVIGTVASNGKKGAELAWERVNAVIQYLVKQHGIPEIRFYFGWDMGEIDKVELYSTEQNNIPAPRPDLKKVMQQRKL